jgi:hypothetical protein
VNADDALQLTRVVGLNASWPTLVQFYMKQGWAYHEALAAAGVKLPGGG